MTLRCLFVDFDSYFASVEQYDDPNLRGRPVGVVPVMADSTCCLAASYEAKAVGVKTGTGVREAREKCPGIQLVLARPARYVELHHRLMDAIQDCVPHAKPLSVDEVPCYLIGRERNRENAETIARSIKQRLLDLGFSPAINCSIGIAPNRFLAKTASDMDKPNGLTIIEPDDLPHALHRLALRDFCGIGPSMEARLHAAGINTVEQLCTATREHLRAAWGSIEGERYWLQLRGFDVPDRKTTRGSIGHSHVLSPELRSYAGMRAVLLKLLAKAAMRLRHEAYLAAGLSIRIRFVGSDRRFERDLQFAPIDDTPSLLHLLGKELQVLQNAVRSGRWDPKRHPPLSIAVTLVGLKPAGSMTAELMPERERAKTMSAVLDRINRRYGNNTVYFGAMQDAIAHNAAPMRIPFSTIPDIQLEEDVSPKRPMRKPAAHDHDRDQELWLQRERQFKVLAEQTHRETQQKPKSHKPSGAGSWAPRPESQQAPDHGPRELF
jgi:DNA polymerase-4